jgi:hypothetical protein
MKVKKLLKAVLIAAAILYVLRSPTSAAETLRTAGNTAYQGVVNLADSAGRFFDALLTR